MKSNQTEDKKLGKIFATGSRKDVEEILKSTKLDVNGPIRHGKASPFWPVSWTALIYACRNLNIEVVQVLLEKGADPNLEGNGGFTPVMALTMSIDGLEEQKIECAKLLVGAGLSIPKVPMSSGRTLLTQAVNRNLTSLLKYFLGVGVNADERDAHGITPLNFAVSKNSMEMVECLRKHGANPFIVNTNGESCLDIASEGQSEGMKNFIASWRNAYYKENFHKNRGKFNEMMMNVNAGCLMHCQKSAKNSDDKKEDLKKAQTGKELLGEPTGPVPGSPAQDVEAFQQLLQDVPATLLRQRQEPSLQISEEDSFGLEFEEEAEMIEHSDLILTPGSENSSPTYGINSPLPSPSPSPPSSPSESSSSRDSKKSDNGKMDSWAHNLGLVIGTAVVTVMACHFLGKFKNAN